MAEFIFQMQNLNRFYPPDKEVLRNINLSFFPGAKIGVIGHNGSGKSSLLKIMAGLDDEYDGDGPGTTPGGGCHSIVAPETTGYSVEYEGRSYADGVTTFEWKFSVAAGAAHALSHSAWLM